jgi:hypothetical protein
MDVALEWQEVKPVVEASRSNDRQVRTTVVIVVALFDQPYQRPYHSGRDIHSTTLVISGGEGGMIGATNMALALALRGWAEKENALWQELPNEYLTLNARNKPRIREHY